MGLKFSPLKHHSWQQSRCEQKIANTNPNKHTHTHASKLGDYNKLSHRLSLTRKPWA